MAANLARGHASSDADSGLPDTSLTLGAPRPYPRPHPGRAGRAPQVQRRGACRPRTDETDSPPVCPSRSANERGRRRRQARGRGQALRRGRGRRPHQPRSADWRVLQPAGPIRLREDHNPADDRRLRAADIGSDRAEGSGRYVAAALQAACQHGLPELRPVPASDDLREHRLRPAPFQGRRRRGQEPRHRHAQARRAARLRATQADPDLRRAGATGRPGARPHQSSGSAPARRTTRCAGPQVAQADAGRAEADPARSRDHLHLRDPRPGRSDDDVGSHRGHEPRPIRAAGRPGEPVRTAADPVRGRLPRRQQSSPGQARRHERRRLRRLSPRRRHGDPGAQYPHRGPRGVRGWCPAREDQAPRDVRGRPRGPEPPAGHHQRCVLPRRLDELHRRDEGRRHGHGLRAERGACDPR